MSSHESRTCEICKFTTDNDKDPVFFGEWMVKHSITVHYYCLLLSANLEQRGKDSGGILGFLLRDIRNEITRAAQTCCMYCKKAHASLRCAKCKSFFHLGCARNNDCRIHFFGRFETWCHLCAPLDEYQRELFANPPANRICDICFRPISKVESNRAVVYGDCCRKGFAHRFCMQQYASSSGYYLRCIWCRKVDFRELIKMQGIFVPDRDAVWELEKNAFSRMYTAHKRCDWIDCLCPKGRTFQTKCWNMVLCKLCASFGAHIKCLQAGKVAAGTIVKDFKCPTCQEVENTFEPNAGGSKNDGLDTSLYMVKESTESTQLPINETPNFTDDETISQASFVTVVPSQNNLQSQTQSNPNPDTSPDKSLNVSELSVAQAQPGNTSVLSSASEEQREELLKTAIAPPKVPLQLKSSYFNLNAPNEFYLEVYAFSDELMMYCVGSFVLLFSVDDPRIQDKTKLENIIVDDKDIHKRSTNRGIYENVESEVMRVLNSE